MKIVYLSASAIPSRSANSIQVMRMCEAFARSGVKTTLLGKQFPDGDVGDIYDYYGVARGFDLSLIPCRRMKGVNILLLPQLRTRLKKYDHKQVLVYARDTYGALLAVRMGFRVIYEVHAMPYNRLLRSIERRLLRSERLIRVVAISQALADSYRARYDVAHKLVVCHDAASSPKESPEGDLPWPGRRQTLHVGYTGHLYEGRGIEIILTCARRLPEYEFHIAGGSEADISYWKSKATSNVYWHGFLEPSRVHCICRRCDVLLMPYQRRLVNPHSRADTSSWMSPMKLFEYMASHRTIIASDLPVLREVLNERMAVFVPPDNPDEWVNAIRRCEDRSFRQPLADEAYKAFLERHTWEKRAERVLEGIGI